MDFKDPIVWNGITISQSELLELNSLANLYYQQGKSREAAWVEAMLNLLNKKGLLKGAA